MNKAGRYTCWVAALVLSIVLGSSVLVAAQTSSAHLKDAAWHPLYSSMYQGRSMETACPCLDSWNYTAADGSLMHLSGCALPDNDSKASAHVVAKSLDTPPPNVMLCWQATSIY